MADEASSVGDANMTRTYPDIDVVIATRDRHELLLATLAAIESQNYPGQIRTFVVYDNFPMRRDLERQSGPRPVTVIENVRTPGLPGSRNTGLTLSTAPIVGFCDDDDMWLPTKVRQQVDLLLQNNALGCVAGIRILYGDSKIERVPPVDRIDSDSILTSRLTGAHPSSYLFRRELLLDQVGLVDEEIPYGYGEDYDLLIRAASAGTIVVLQEPAVEVLWHKGGSYFSRRWEAMDAGIAYLMSKHPDLSRSRKAAGWLYGQRAFAQASAGERRAAVSTAVMSIRHDPRQLRGYLAVAVAAGLLRPKWVVDQLNARGRGI
ncbi:MAG: glycosyltransferase family 2 protein [Tessaracoccus sp.]|uniref:glycosyltransferase family 2 protein n=1 Tax=Tessaracoccus sp. TaxID=1971211 RepID=UPI001EC14D23|nr:glycosyltransferase family A protein [Tessaracoccus sp.]MBK7822190.1 glycosyltransferase family 2 protein [Tessaracoccus sp.]